MENTKYRSYGFDIEAMQYDLALYLISKPHTT